MDQHLVDDDLHKERGQEGEELQEKRGDEHFPEQRPVLDEGGDEPGEIEREIVQAQIGPLGEQQDVSRPGRLELLARENQRARLGRILDEDLLPFELCEHDIAAICALRQSGKRNPAELVPVGSLHAGLEPQVFGGTEQIGLGEELPRLRELMA